MKTQPKKQSYFWKLFGLSLLALSILAALWLAPSPVPRLSSPDKAPPWTTVETTLIDLEPTWTQVRLLIEEGKVLRAEQLLDHELRPVWFGALKHYADQPMGDSPMLSRWVDAHEEEVTALLRAHFDKAIARVASGDLALDQLQTFLMERDDPELFQLLDDAGDRLIQQRIDAASQWYRVVIQTPDDQVLNLPDAEKLIRKASRSPDFIKLVFGPALSDEEQAVTWNTLLITGQVQTANFSAEINNSFKEQTWTPDPMVIGTSWYPKELRSDHATSWNNLEEIHVWLKPPAQISRSLEADIQATYLQRIHNGISQHLARWPALEPKIQAD